jgi:integrase
MATAFFFQITKAGARSWVFRFSSPEKFDANGHRVTREMGLGGYPNVLLAKARKEAAKLRAKVAEGCDPLEAKRNKRVQKIADARKRKKFRVLAEEFVESRRAEWKNQVHAKQWAQTLRDYAFPVLGELDVMEVTKNHVLQVLAPIWTDKTETASRLQGRISNILDYAVSLNLRADNPARWAGNLEFAGLPSPRKLTRRKRAPHKALAIDDMAQFMTELRANPSQSARALEFTILTAARTGETIGAMWSEIDMVDNTWTIPAARMKAEADHKVFLSVRTLEILKSLPRKHGNNHVFVGGEPGCGLSNMAMYSLLQHMRPTYTVHGFRSTFRDWAEERTSHKRSVIERSLAHTNDDKVEAAYLRSESRKMRQDLSTDWMKFCGSPSGPRASNVVSIKVRA